ncbi:MAG: winged helix-turn-helix transcriptional regulator [Candidatus Hodarchaeales archaeon]
MAKFKFWIIGSFCLLSIIVHTIPPYQPALSLISQEETSYQVLYANQNDRELAQFLSTKDGFSFSYSSLSGFTPLGPARAKSGVILIASEHFVDTNSQTSLYINSMVESNKTVILFTPYLDDLSLLPQQSWGIGESFSIFPASGNDNFSLAITEAGTDKFSLNHEDSFNFSGKIAVSESLGSNDIFVSVTNTTTYETDSPAFPVPVVYSSSVYQLNMLVLAFSYEQAIDSMYGEIKHKMAGNRALESNQQQNFLDAFLSPIIRIFLQDSLISSVIDSSSQVSESGSSDNGTGDIISLFGSPLLPAVLFILSPLLLLFSLIYLLVWQRSLIMHLLKKFRDKGLYLVVFVGLQVVKPVFRRLEHEDLLDNQARKSIIDYLEKRGESGAYFNELKTDLKIGNGALLWHLQILNEYHIINIIKIYDFKIYYLKKYNIDLNQKRLELALKSTTGQKIARILLKNEGLSVSEVAEKVKRHRKTVSTHLNKLEEMKIIKGYKKGRKRVFQVNDAISLEMALSKLSDRT